MTDDRPTPTYPLPPAASFVDITPAMAAYWLTEHHDGPVRQRPRSANVTSRYARAMRIPGAWLPTHQGIAFDAQTGQLYDGQHRLAAIVQADVTVRMWVVPDGDAAHFGVLDTGFKRTAGQLVRSTQGAMIAAAARFLCALDGAAPRTLNGCFARDADNAMILATIDRWPELYDGCATAGRIRSAGIPPSPHLAVIAQAMRSDHSHALPSWVTGLVHGVGLQDGSPMLTLRSRFMRASTSWHSNTQRIMAYDLLVRGWNAHASGQRWYKAVPMRDGSTPPRVLGLPEPVPPVLPFDDGTY